MYYLKEFCEKICCLEESYKKSFDFQESYKDWIFLQDSSKNYVLNESWNIRSRNVFLVNYGSTFLVKISVF